MHKYHQQHHHDDSNHHHHRHNHHYLNRNHRCCLTAVFLLLAVAIVSPGRAEHVVLLDTTTEPSLRWTTYPYGPDANAAGWVEESYINFEKGINWRSYVVCDVTKQNVNNWVWTPFIERGLANLIYIEVKFTIRDCSLFPGYALSCKETFSLLYYEFDVATREPPPWEPDSYKSVGRIAAGEGRFNANNEVVINTETKAVKVTKKGVYFAFRDQGACISIMAVKVYYIVCPEVVINFANFSATPTARELTQIEHATGKCVDNAEVVGGGAPTYLCKGDGKWYLPSGGCKCKAGFEADIEAQTCIICPPGKYKYGVGDDKCQPCPAHSKAPDQGMSECRCNTGYYRSPKDPKSVPCTQPPSAPQNLTVNFVDQSTVTLSWNPPNFLGGRTDIVYRVTCDMCGPSVLFMPNNEVFNDTKITISGLSPVTTYKFHVWAENGVSNLTSSENRQFVDIAVTTTEASVKSASVNNVRVMLVKASEITLSWDPPMASFFDSGDDDAAVEVYEVKFYPRGDESNVSNKLTADRHMVFTALRPKTDYGFQVRAKTAHGWGEYSPTIYKTTGQLLGSGKNTQQQVQRKNGIKDDTAYIGDEDNMEVRIIAGATVAVVVVLVVVIIMTVLFLRSRSNDECNKKQPSDCDTLEYRNGEGLVVTYMTTPLFTQVGSTTSRSYIDPHTYEDPNQAVKEFAREIDASYITIEAIIGGGEFGDVCRGKLKVLGSPSVEVDVAIKTLKPGSTDKARNDFLTEASIMGQFEHPNVIFLQGVVTRSNPVMIITEYMENGSLDTFLRANDGKFQVLQLVGMLRGIASGMQYLSEMNYVHRDLAARNVLVNAQLVCKIADFGLSREIESTTEGAYTTRFSNFQGGKIPVRWTAPEAIAFRKFTSASDVWSFGIVVWEVMSYGERPYWNWSNQDVIKSIEKGYRLPAPMDCPETIYQLMLDCWQKERTHRPMFMSIVKTLDKLIRCPDTLRRIAQNRSVNPLSSDAPDMTQFGSVNEWLCSIKMARYLDNFEQAGIVSPKAVARLTVADLTALGITLVGHQKKIMNSIQAMRAQFSANLSEGFLV
ncbi:ephrin type-B receptor 1-B isoform X4 [Acyrthosiphon pisum]|uniref:receptor protein-tyrosine kinase n=1 Tax=Acyrthosiphon pisum TaxID=7029 RepID=A0A8R2F9V4_ACYPI|nr:ephrin type-B receptor 1-B isoform X4 [Acyrthosiphon pisum]|eukprot:XP_008184482.1 PREDICTED: ephrin type-B receptor 1-B isoform X3 [Acyrthosiphon pisum]